MTTPKQTDDELAVLMLDYEMGRDDERTTFTILAAVFGVGITVLVAIAAVTGQACTLTDRKPSPSVFSNAPDCIDVNSEWVLAAVPLPALALAAFLVLVGQVGTVRSYYLRGLEAELRRHGPILTTMRRPTRAGAYMEFLSGLTSLKRGTWGYPLVAGLLVGIMATAFGGLLLYIAVNANEALTRILIVGYVPPLLLLMWEATNGTAGGRSLFLTVRDNYLRRWRAGEQSSVPQRRGETDKRCNSEAEGGPKQRSMLSYLLIPRPEDAAKAFLFPGAFAVAAAGLGDTSATEVLRAALIWFVLDYLLYEARYQWNDARDYPPRQEGDVDKSRGRLPVGKDKAEQKRNLDASLGIAAVRILMALLLGLAYGGETFVIVVVLAVLVFGMAALYETLRERAPSATAAKAQARLDRSIWIVVGFGYAVRAGAGLFLAGFALTSAPLLVGLVAFSAFGTMFVTMTWVLEALADASRQPGSLDLEPDPVTSSHLRRLLEHLAVLPDPPPCTGQPKSDTKEDDAKQPEVETDEDGKPFARARGLRAPSAWTAPWSVSLLLSGALVVVIGIWISDRGNVEWLAAPIAVPALLPLAVLLSGKGAMNLAGAAVLGAAIPLAGALLIGVDKPWLAPIPWLAIAGIYCFFRETSYDALKFRLGPLDLFRISKAALGSRTAEHFYSQRDR